MVASRNILPPKRWWTPAEEELLRQRYADSLTADLAVVLGMRTNRVLAKANAMGLHKSRDLIAETARQRTMQPGHGSHRTRIKPGQEPWNKGTQGLTGTQEACRATQFRPGNRPSSWVPIGSYRLVEDGTCVERKVSDLTGPQKRANWVAVTRLVWEAAHGPIPAGCVVAFKPGRQTIDPELITADKLDCLTRAQLMNRNSHHTNLPPELSRLVQLRGVLSRAINAKAKEAKTYE